MARCGGRSKGCLEAVTACGSDGTSCMQSWRWRGLRGSSRGAQRESRRPADRQEPFKMSCGDQLRRLQGWTCCTAPFGNLGRGGCEAFASNCSNSEMLELSQALCPAFSHTRGLDLSAVRGNPWDTVGQHSLRASCPQALRASADLGVLHAHWHAESGLASRMKGARCKTVTCHRAGGRQLNMRRNVAAGPARLCVHLAHISLATESY